MTGCWWFELPRWRIGRGEMKRIPLSVKRKVPAAEKNVWPALLRPYDILRFRARVLDDHGFSRALLDGFYGQDASDPDLRWHAESLRRPPTHLDSVLGTVTHDPRRDWYAVKANWNGTPMVLRVPADNDRSLDEALRTARVLWQEQAVWNARILDHAAGNLLPLKNSNWREAGAVELTADQFRQRMSLDSAIVDADGRFQFWYGDGGLLRGRVIEIAGNLEDGPNSTDLLGMKPP